jgi:hypothetical protein
VLCFFRTHPLSHLTMQNHFFSLSLMLHAILIWLSISCNNGDMTCSNFKTGKFLYHSKYTNTDYSINRNDSIQTETNLSTGKATKGRVVWINSCEFNLFNIAGGETTDGVERYFQTTPINIKIVGMTPNYYVFTASADSVGKSLRITDTMRVQQ